jgi:hypothetical protein
MHLTPFLDCRETVTRTRRDLPHWHQPLRLQFVTWNLADALPAKALKRLERQKAVWLHHHSKPWNAEEEQEYFSRFEERVDRWLALGRGEAVLRNSACSDLLAKTLMYFEGQRTRMDAFVIMPNHVHCLFQVMNGQGLSDILHSWRGIPLRKSMVC